MLHLLFSGAEITRLSWIIMDLMDSVWPEVAVSLRDGVTCRIFTFPSVWTFSKLHNDLERSRPSDRRDRGVLTSKYLHPSAVWVIRCLLFYILHGKSWTFWIGTRVALKNVTMDAVIYSECYILGAPKGTFRISYKIDKDVHLTLRYRWQPFKKHFFAWNHCAHRENDDCIHRMPP